MKNVSFVDKQGQKRLYTKSAHFAEFSENSTMSSRKVSLYPKLIHIGKTVGLAAGVSLIPHDMIHAMLNNKKDGLEHLFETRGIPSRNTWAVF